MNVYTYTQLIWGATIVSIFVRSPHGHGHESPYCKEGRYCCCKRKCIKDCKKKVAYEGGKGPHRAQRVRNLEMDPICKDDFSSVRVSKFQNNSDNPRL